MWFILQEDDIYFPSLSLFISYKVNLPDSILSLPHQDGGEKAQVLVTPPWLVKKLCWTLQTLCYDSRQSAGTTLCLSYKSQSLNSQGWHHDIFKNSKRPALSGNQFCLTNLGILFQAFFFFFVTSSAYMRFPWSSKYYLNFIS